MFASISELNNSFLTIVQLFRGLETLRGHMHANTLIRSMFDCYFGYFGCFPANLLLGSFSNSS